MPYNVTITIHGSENPSQVAQYISQLIERSTGQKVTVHIHNRQLSNQKNQKEIASINQKLLK
jgi:hypothetical protein